MGPFSISEYLWVAEESGEVILEISNPLPIDLDVTNIVSMLFFPFRLSLLLVLGERNN